MQRELSDNNGGAHPNLIRPGPSRIARTARNTAGVRRNLFQSQLTRRPTSGHTTTTNPSSSNNSAETLRLNVHNNSNSSSGDNKDSINNVDVLSDTSDIVIRDKNGDFEVGDSPTPLLDDSEEEAALDDAQENERERQKLAEAVRHHQRTTAQPEDVLEVLRASMRAKIAALTEDNWMYETETEPSG